MRKLVKLLTPALLAVAALFAAGGAPPVACPAPGRPDDARDSPRAGTPWMAAAAIPGAVVPAAGPAARAPSGPEAAPRTEPGERARALLRDLRAWVAAGFSDPPEVIVREIAALIDEDPANSGIFLAALDGASRREWTVLGCAFVRVSEPDRRTRLLDAHRKADPFLPRLAAALADPSRTVDAVRDGSDPEFRRRVIDAAPLAGPVIEELRRIAAGDPDDQTRARVIARLAGHAVPESRDFVLSILADESRPEGDRLAAAFALSYRTDPELRRTWVDLVERRAPAALRSHALRGLGPYVGDPEVRDLLLGELSRSGADPIVRSAAAASLAQGMRGVAEADRVSVRQRIRDLVASLEAESGSSDLRARLIADFGLGAPAAGAMMQISGGGR